MIRYGISSVEKEGENELLNAASYFLSSLQGPRILGLSSQGRPMWLSSFCSLAIVWTTWELMIARVLGKGLFHNGGRDMTFRGGVSSFRNTSFNRLLNKIPCFSSAYVRSSHVRQISCGKRDITSHADRWSFWAVDSSLCGLVHSWIH